MTGTAPLGAPQPARIALEHHGDTERAAVLVAALGRSALIPSYVTTSLYEDRSWPELLHRAGPYPVGLDPTDGSARVDDFGIGGDPHGTGLSEGTHGSFYLRWRGDDGIYASRGPEAP